MLLPCPLAITRLCTQGGTLVLAGTMSAGALVSFMLFQQSLSSAFQVGRCAMPLQHLEALQSVGSIALAWQRVEQHVPA